MLARPTTKLFGLMSALTVYYAFVVTAGKFQLLHWTSDFYDQLAEGFRAGHLYIKALPSAALLARENPWDWQSPDDWDEWKWDMSLYNGHYYVYFGPVPALLLLGAKLFYSGVVHDQWIVLFCMLMRLYAGTALIVRYARDQYPQLASWALYLAIVVFAVASPTAFFMVRPVVYEACIASGQGFLCLGLYCAYMGLRAPQTQARWFVAAGSCLGCAAASRASLIISAPLIVAATLFCAQRAAGYSLRKLMAAGLALAGPLAVCLALYALYNQLRFESPFEFGLKYQLTGRQVTSETRFLLPNLASYLGAELSWSCKFPFVRLPSHRELASWIDWPSDYDLGAAGNGERVGGVLFASTICWLWGVWLWRAVAWAQRKPGALFSNRELWLTLCSLAMIAAGFPASRMYLAAMRYLQDAASGIVLGGIVAGLWLLRPRPGFMLRRRLGAAVYAALTIHTIFVGLSLGFTGYADNFHGENKALFGRLERSLSVCGWKRRLHNLGLYTLQPFESAAIYVACGDAVQLDTRKPHPQGPAARP
jgi:hypothetical protein